MKFRILLNYSNNILFHSALDGFSLYLNVRYLLVFLQNTIPNPMSGPEVRITDKEFYFKAFIYLYVDNTGTCVHEVLCSASHYDKYL